MTIERKESQLRAGVAISDNAEHNERMRDAAREVLQRSGAACGHERNPLNPRRTPVAWFGDDCDTAGLRERNSPATAVT
jgi:hypothetical protein